MCNIEEMNVVQEPMLANTDLITFSLNHINKIIKENNSELKEDILELKIENKEQAIKINKLETENKELKLEIKELKEENKELKEEIKELKEEIKDLKKDIIDLKNKDEYNKFVIAMHDLNRRYKIEEKYKKEYTNVQCLFRLRKDRRGISHYLDDSDDSILINNKMIVFLEKLNTMNDGIKSKFNKKYPNMVDFLLKYMNSIPITPINNTDDLDEIYEWWED